MRWAVFVGYGLALTAVSLTPGTDLPEITYNDKIAHFAAYWLFAVLARALPVSHLPMRYAPLLIALYGGLIEVCQGALIPGRHADPLDAIANALGALCGWWIANRYWQRKPQQI